MNVTDRKRNVIVREIGKRVYFHSRNTNFKVLVEKVNEEKKNCQSKI